MERPEVTAEIPADIIDEYEELLVGSVDALPDGELLRQLVRARTETVLCG